MLIQRNWRDGLGGAEGEAPGGEGGEKEEEDDGDDVGREQSNVQVSNIKIV